MLLVKVLLSVEGLRKIRDRERQRETEKDIRDRDRQRQTETKRLNSRGAQGGGEQLPPNHQLGPPKLSAKATSYFIIAALHFLHVL